MRHTLTLVAAAFLSSCALFGTRTPEYDPVTLASGVIVRDLVVPKRGAEASPGDRVTFHYELSLDDGTTVDSSYERGQPVETRLGEGLFPRGLEDGIVGMRRFGRRSIFVPANQGYGAEGLPPHVPPNAALRFLLEIMELEPAASP